MNSCALASQECAHIYMLNMVETVLLQEFANTVVLHLKLKPSVRKIDESAQSFDLDSCFRQSSP